MLHIEWIKLIHEADPQSQPVGIVVFAHVVCSYVRPSPHFKTKQISSENNVHYWRGCGSGRVDHWWHQSCAHFIFSRNLTDDVPIAGKTTWCYLVIVRLKTFFPLYKKFFYISWDDIMLRLLDRTRARKENWCTGCEVKSVTFDSFISILL